MKIKVDLTGDRFSNLRLVGFYDSKILFFQPPRELPSSLSFEVWGADIFPEFPWSEYLSQEDLAKLGTKLSESNGLLIVRGLGLLSFEGLQGGYCSLTPRDPTDPDGDFFTMANGKQYSVKREWPYDKDIEGLHCYAFVGADIDFPRSGAMIYFYATGSVSFEFDLEDCLSSSEYWRTRGYMYESAKQNKSCEATGDNVSS